MKTYLTIISVLLLVIYFFSTSNAQTNPCNNERLLYLQEKDSLSLYESDELIVLEAQCNEYKKQPIQYSPCNDPLLAGLQQKDSLTAYEVELYLLLTERCTDYNNKQVELQQRADRNTTIKNTYTTYYIVAILGIVVSYLIYAQAMSSL